MPNLVSHRQTGRPSIYGTDIASEICRRIAEGEPLSRICREPDMPGYGTVLLWRASNREFAELYARAREDAADTYADRIVELGEAVVRGELDPYAGRVAIDAMKWVCCKLKPRSYGEKLGVEHSGSVRAPELRSLDHAPQWIRERLAARRLSPPDSIAVTNTS